MPRLMTWNTDRPKAPKVQAFRQHGNPLFIGEAGAIAVAKDLATRAGGAALQIITKLRGDDDGLHGIISQIIHFRHLAVALRPWSGCGTIWLAAPVELKV